MFRRGAEKKADWTRRVVRAMHAEGQAGEPILQARSCFLHDLKMSTEAGHSVGGGW